MRRPHIADRRNRTSRGTTAPVQPGPHRMQKPHNARSLAASRIILRGTGGVRFYNKRGTAEQWIKESKQAVALTRLSCHRCDAAVAGGISEA